MCWTGWIVLGWSLACAGTPSSTGAGDPAPAAGKAPAGDREPGAKAKRGKRRDASGCEPGEMACQDQEVVKCEQTGGAAAWSPVEDCNQRQGGTFLCIEVDSTRAECRQGE